MYFPANDDSNTPNALCFSLNSIGLNGIWKQTSYNSNFRKNYAGIDYTYDESRDAFISVKPYPSWILNEDTCQWESPIERPTDDVSYIWNEEILNWGPIV